VLQMGCKREVYVVSGLRATDYGLQIGDRIGDDQVLRIKGRIDRIVFDC